MISPSHVLALMTGLLISHVIQANSGLEKAAIPSSLYIVNWLSLGSYPSLSNREEKKTREPLLPVFS